LKVQKNLLPLAAIGFHNPDVFFETVADSISFRVLNQILMQNEPESRPNNDQRFIP
jgi:hypothetical protein